MKNSKDAELSPWQRLLVVGRTGSGKSAQIWTLPGRKFAYLFDVNSLPTLRGLDMDYEEFYPDFTELDATLKGFNKGSKDDTMKAASKREPTVYNRWIEDINAKEDMFKQGDYQWLIFDSLTYLVKAVMDRQMYINNRYGGIEDLADYRVVGSKVAEVFNSIVTLPINMYATGHIRTYENETTKEIETLLMLPGKARDILPLTFTNIWVAKNEDDKYLIQTKAQKRGMKDVRTSIPGLKPEEDVTLKGLDRTAEGRQGIGAILRRYWQQSGVNMIGAQ
jgi:hypothetical protein